MVPSPGASSASPLTIRVVRVGATTCLSMRGRLGSSNRDKFDHALRAIVLAATTRVELDLTELESCDADAAFELAVFAGEVRDRGGHVAVVSAGPLILTMLTLADVGGALAMPLPDPSTSLPRSTREVSAEQAVTLHWLLGVLDHDGVGPRPVEGSPSRLTARAAPEQ